MTKRTGPDLDRLRSVLNSENVRRAQIWAASEKATSLIAFAALTVFGLYPAIVAAKTVRHRIWDIMVMDSEVLMDLYLVPMVTKAAEVILILLLVRFWQHRKGLLKCWANHPTLILFALLACWMFLSQYVIHENRSLPPALIHETASLQIKYILCFLPLGLMLRSAKMKQLLFCELLCISGALVPTAFFLWRNLRATVLVQSWYPQMSCFFTNTNYYGYYLSTLIGLAAAMFAGATTVRCRLFYGIILAANSVALYYNNTLGAWIASVCACGFLIVALRIRDGMFHPWAAASLGIVLLGLILPGIAQALGGGISHGNLMGNCSQFASNVGNIIFDSSSEASMRAGSGRWIIWMRCLTLIKAHPWFGIGFEGITVLDIISYVTNARPHNEVMQYALFYGIPAGVLYTFGCLGVYLRAIRRRAQLDNLTLAALTAAFGYLAGSQFGHTVYNTTPYLFIMLGLGYVSSPSAQKKWESTD